MEEYARLDEAGTRGPEGDILVEALLNGLSADPGLLVGAPQEFLAPCEADRAGFCERFHAYRQTLVDSFERLRPSPRSYSPLSFFFNFSQNVLKGVVIDALLWAEPWRLSLNDLLTGLPTDDGRGPDKQKLATSLMTYARKRPDRIRGKLMPAIVYDPQAGVRAFTNTMQELKER